MDAVLTLMIEVPDEEAAAQARDALTDAALEAGILVKSWSSAVMPTEKFIVSGVDTEASEPFSQEVLATTQEEAEELVAGASESRVVAHVEAVKEGEELSKPGKSGAHGLEKDDEPARPGAPTDDSKPDSVDSTIDPTPEGG